MDLEGGSGSVEGKVCLERYNKEEELGRQRQRKEEEKKPDCRNLTFHMPLFTLWSQPSWRLYQGMVFLLHPVLSFLPASMIFCQLISFFSPVSKAISPSSP